ncbi:MAG: ABC transporter permease [Acidobacteriota bacterium]
MNLRPFAALVRKDLALFFSDRRAVLLSLAAPIAIAAFFGFLFSGSSSESAPIVVLVADEDGSPLSREITAKMSQDPALEVRRVPSAGEAREVVRKGKASAALVFPAGFGERSVGAFFGRAEKPDLLLLHDPSRVAEASMLRGILTQHAMEAVSREAFSGPQGRIAAEDSLAQVQANPDLPARDKEVLQNLLQSVISWQERTSEPGGTAAGGPAGGLSIPFRAVAEPVTSKKGVVYNGYAHSFAGMAVQFILMSAIEFGVGILLERRSGIWRRLRAAPVPPGTLLLSRGVSGALLSLLIFLVCMGFGMAVFGVRIRGSAIGFFALGAAYSLMAGAFGVMLAALGRTPEATRGLAIFAVLLMVMLGGGWVPAFLFPAWLNRATLALPTRWAVDGLDAVTWRGLGLEAALPAAGILIAFTLLFSLIAVWRFRWEEA